MSRNCTFTISSMSCQTACNPMISSIRHTVVLRNTKTRQAASSVASTWPSKSLSISMVVTLEKNTITRTLENCMPLIFHLLILKKPYFRTTTSCTYQTIVSTIRAASTWISMDVQRVTYSGMILSCDRLATWSMQLLTTSLCFSQVVMMRNCIGAGDRLKWKTASIHRSSPSQT